MAADKTGARRLAVRIRAANGRFVKDTGDILRQTAMVYAEELVRNTAVDTGETRSNWRVAKSQNVTAVRPPFFPYPKKTDDSKFLETANADATLADIHNSLTALSDKALASGTPFFVVNASWIADALNDGTIKSKFRTYAGYIDAARVAATSYLSSFGKLYYGR